MEKNLAKLCGEYLRQCSTTNRLRSETVRGYQSVFLCFSRVMPEVTETDHLTKEMVNLFFERIQTRSRLVGKIEGVTGVKDSTVKTYWSKLKYFFDWLEKNGNIESNPFSSMGKPPHPRYEDSRALDKESIGRIISSVTMNNSNPLLMKRDMAMFNTLLYTGIRKGELLGLRVQDIDFEKYEITIQGATSKSKRTRIVPMNPTLAMHLKEYLNERKEKKYKTMFLWVSGNEDKGFSVHGLKHWTKRYNEFSGVKFHLHRFRHTFACCLVDNNVHIVKIQKLMGHTDIKMTQAYLRSVTASDCRDDINKLSY